MNQDVESHRLGGDLLGLQQRVDGGGVHAPHGVPAGKIDQES